MNDALLSQRLRALRVPPPANGFELRLREALRTEAGLIAAAAPGNSARQRAARRWTGRAGLTLAIALGASAAAAAAGWMSWAPREEAGQGVNVSPAAGSASRRKEPRAREADPVPSAPAPSAPEPMSEATQPRVVDAPAPVERALPSRAHQSTSHAASARTASPVRSERPSHEPHEAPPVKRRSAGVIAPFELPGVDLSSPASPDRGSDERGRSSDARARRAEPKDVVRPLPRLERTSPDRAERGKSEMMRERRRAPELRGRGNAERGLERAREARERNGK